jgi:hypothetical protein
LLPVLGRHDPRFLHAPSMPRNAPAGARLRRWTSPRAPARSAIR